MSHAITKTKINFSGKVALFSVFIIGAMITGQASANDFTPSEQAAIDQHMELLSEQQVKSDEAMIDNQQQGFDAGLEKAENKFMTNICDEHGREYDNATEVCYEQK
ncbi:hypothetical protein Sps_05306 [Shewanella psychrophila]|uniref:Uncharacterized protein n=1 Tax=Shewanella psychrophila TaxID=225848 RepID=A0A1S6HXU6_9GAMM|nr:hypothetical protein [Shewanella psychrophila]AQS40375.1 hypothetical protein Sps_05306 [Shewanella psychrophila]